MEIAKFDIGLISVPLRRPFKTALRTVDSVNDIIVRLETKSGIVGFGEAPPTGVITGDTKGAIIGALQDHISKAIIGAPADNLDEIMGRLDSSCLHNTSAKAAVDMAIYDIFAKSMNAPLYKVLGGYRNNIETDITISVNSPEEMAADSVSAVAEGYKVLKIKVGKEPARDIERIKKIREAIGYDTLIRIDANQGWKPKEAIRILRSMEDAGLNIELCEQPVIAHDVEGLKLVTDNSGIPILADESLFSPLDAMKIIRMRAADMLNLKLMKTGGIHNALKIISMAETNGMECMMGCMLEANVAVTAAVHLACAKKVFTKIDLDGPVLLKTNPVIGGASFNYRNITLSDAPGLGITDVEGVTYI